MIIHQLTLMVKAAYRDDNIVGYEPYNPLAKRMVGDRIITCQELDKLREDGFAIQHVVSSPYQFPQQGVQREA